MESGTGPTLHRLDQRVTAVERRVKSLTSVVRNLDGAVRQLFAEVHKATGTTGEYADPLGPLEEA